MKTIFPIKGVFFLLFSGIFLCHSAFSQITLNLALNNRPQPWLADWVNPVNGQMIITYNPGPVLNDPTVKLRTTLISENGSIIGSSNSDAARIFTLRTGVNQFSIADALQLQNLILPGSVQSLLKRTGRLNAGQYQLKVEVTNVIGDLVRATQTRPFQVVSYQLPVLIQPSKDAILDARIAQNVIVFRWSNLVPASSEIPSYRVQVFEVLRGQTPLQAFRGNRPLLDEPAQKGTTQYVWRPNLPMLDSTANKQFIWTVQTLDRDGRSIPAMDITTQGRSEPSVFSVTGKTKTP